MSFFMIGTPFRIVLKGFVGRELAENHGAHGEEGAPVHKVSFSASASRWECTPGTKAPASEF